MLGNIRKPIQNANIQCDTVIKNAEHVYHRAGFGDPRYNVSVMPTFLSSPQMKILFKVTFHSGAPEKFVFHLTEGHSERFRRVWQGLSDSQILGCDNMTKDVNLTVANVQGNKSWFMKWEAMYTQWGSLLYFTLVLPNSLYLKKISNQLATACLSMLRWNARVTLRPLQGKMKQKTVRSK